MVTIQLDSSPKESQTPGSGSSPLFVESKQPATVIGTRKANNSPAEGLSTPKITNKSPRYSSPHPNARSGAFLYPVVPDAIDVFRNPYLSHSMTGNGTPRPTIGLALNGLATPTVTTGSYQTPDNKFMSPLPPHPSYFQPRHQVFAVYPTGCNQGYLYTAGLHSQGFPELFAQHVPKSRCHVVTKNMYFLASRMIAGHKVSNGDKSTDWDYRVSIREISGSHDLFRKSLLFHNMLHCHPDSSILVLNPYYGDCEEWGSFPPAPGGERERRNRIAGFALFPRSHTLDLSQSEEDAEYLVHNLNHFAALVNTRRPEALIAAMPPPIRSAAESLFANTSKTNDDVPSLIDTKQSALSEPEVNGIKQRKILMKMPKKSILKKPKKIAPANLKEAPRATGSLAARAGPLPAEAAMWPSFRGTAQQIKIQLRSQKENASPPFSPLKKTRATKKASKTNDDGEYPSLLDTKQLVLSEPEANGTKKRKLSTKVPKKSILKRVKKVTTENPKEVPRTTGSLAANTTVSGSLPVEIVMPSFRGAAQQIKIQPSPQKENGSPPFSPLKKTRATKKKTSVCEDNSSDKENASKPLRSRRLRVRN